VLWLLIFRIKINKNTIYSKLWFAVEGGESLSYNSRSFETGFKKANDTPMKNFLLLGSVFLLLTACGQEDPPVSGEKTNLTLYFKGLYGDSPLLMYAKEYPYEAGMQLRFQLFQFYISDFSLLRKTAGGIDTVRVLDVALVSFENIQDPAKAAEGVKIDVKGVPAGEYVGAHVGIGVAPRLNATSPGDYKPPHPLDGNYWSWAKGYIFTKIEGNADLKGDGKFAEKLTFHIGENPYYRQKSFQGNFVIGDAVNQLQFDVNLRRVLVAEPGKFLDFRVVTADHTTNKDIARFIADNLQASVEMRKK
jgi:hypothetical protein